jgi:hypothetical protein
VASQGARIVLQAVDDVCPPDVQRTFATYLALRHLDFVTRTRGVRVKTVLSLIEQRIAPWWRHGLSHAMPLERSEGAELSGVHRRWH